MIIYPAIDLRGGRCVRLQQGDFARETVYADDPVEAAGRWAAEGAAWLHVVNLDGALGRSGEANLAALAASAGRWICPSARWQATLRRGRGPRPGLGVPIILGTVGSAGGIGPRGAGATAPGDRWHRRPRRAWRYLGCGRPRRWRPWTSAAGWRRWRPAGVYTDARIAC